MSLSQWISSILQLPRPTSSHLHLLNENQPLQTWQLSSHVELTGARNVGSDGLNILFQEKITNLGGKENILLVGESGYSPEDDGGSSGMLEELSSALFQLPRKAIFWKTGKNTTNGSNPSLSYVTSRSPSESRMLEFPIVLAVFQVRLITGCTNSIREILKDIRFRTREFGSAIVGIVYSWEAFNDETKIKSKEQLSNLMSQVFKNQSWGVCCYNSSDPKSILEVKQVIMETMGVTRTDRYQSIEDDRIQLERSFQELVGQVGGKERFLLVGNICPFTCNSEKTWVFKELTKALFDDDHCMMEAQEEEDQAVTPEMERKSTKECIQLPKPRSFPYPLILVVFRSTFLKEEVNMSQVKEILADIKKRVTMCSTQVIGVVFSDEPLEGTKEQRYQTQLQKILHRTFSCPTGVCSFVRTNTQSVEGVKRCVCNVLKRS